jgi:hypothetical protein
MNEQENWGEKWKDSTDAARWLEFADVEKQVFLVNWGDQYGQVMCTITKDSEGTVSATELIAGSLPEPSYRIEETTLVIPISKATVDWHDDAGPCSAEPSVRDGKLLAKSEEWACEEQRENGCYITSLREIDDDDDIDGSDGWSVYAFK